MSRQKYVCKKECAYVPGSSECLIHMVRKLVEEAAELQEAIAIYYAKDYRAPITSCLFVTSEWNDVKTMVSGLEQFFFKRARSKMRLSNDGE
ncbi:MAG: hypothetical protein QW491_09450 [Thermoproteota archaeon]